MRFVRRTQIEAPSYFGSPAAKKEIAGVYRYLSLHGKERRQTRPNISDRVLHDRGVVSSLRKLFLGKCAFCEQVLNDQAFTRRFRPATNARDTASHEPSIEHYVWLAIDWRNIYLCCETCSRDRDGYFPVAGNLAPTPREPSSRTSAEAFPPQEDNLLLDPCHDEDIAGHLIFHGNGLCESVSARGTETIDYFWLNRDALISGRSAVFEDRSRELYDFVRSRKLEIPERLFEPSREFSGAWMIYAQRLLGFVAKRLGVGGSGSSLFSPAFFHELSDRADGVALLDAAVATDLEEASRSNEGYAGQPERPHLSARFSMPSKVEVTGFKSLERLEFLLPTLRSNPSTASQYQTPALLILGENAVGKSTILEALALALVDRRTIIDSLQLNPRRFIIDSTLMGGRQKSNQIATVTIAMKSGASRHLSISSSGFQASDERAPPVFAYGAFRQYQSNHADSPAEGTSRIATLFYSDRILPDPEPWLLNLPESQFDMVIRALRPILAIEGDFNVVERNEEGMRCDIVTGLTGASSENPSAGQSLLRTPLREVSSGFRSMLAMACNIFQGLMDRQVNPSFTSLESAQAVVLVDEIEAHLHPRWKMQVMRGLRIALPNVYFIATTHDPLCLRGMLDGEVMVITRTAQRELPRATTNLPMKVETLVELPDVSKLTIGQLLTSDFFRLHSTDSPETEHQLAQVADILVARRNGQPFEDGQEDVLKQFSAEIAEALPVGSSEAQRLVQEAVAEFLKKRRKASAEGLAKLRTSTKQRILDILEGF